MPKKPPIGFQSFGPQPPVAATSQPAGVPHGDVVVTEPSPPVKPPDAGRGADLGSSKTSFWDLPVLTRQKMLKAAGYDVTIDGQAGPQTFTASKAYVKGIPASYWNLAWKRNHQPPAVDVPPGGSDASNSGATDTPTPTPKRTTTAAPTAANPLNDLLKTILGNLGSSKAATPEQLLAQAKAMADASLLPYKTELERQQAQATADAEHNAQFQGNLAAALAELEKTQGPATESAYRAAGADQSAFAKGFATDLAATAGKDATQTNDFLRSIGAPDAQMLDPGKGAAIGDLLYGLGGYLPATALAREGAAFTGAANLLPQTAVGRGQQFAADELAAGLANKKTIGQQLIDLQLQRPKILSDSLAQLQDAALKSRAQAQNDAMLPLLLAKDFEGFPGVNPLTGLPTKTQTSFDIQVGNQKLRVAQLDTQTQQWTARYNLDVKKLGLAEWKATHPNASGGFTAKQISDLRGRAGAIAHDAFYGVAGDSKHKGLPPLTYGDALREIVNAGVPLSVAQEALNSYWTKPGYGRTWDQNGDEYVFTGWVKSDGGRPRAPLKVRVNKRK